MASTVWDSSREGQTGTGLSRDRDIQGQGYQGTGTARDWDIQRQEQPETVTARDSDRQGQIGTETAKDSQTQSWTPSRRRCKVLRQRPTELR